MLLLPILLTITAPATPVRVATLVPYVAEAVGRVGPPAELVATVRRDLRTPPPPPTIDLGNPHSPSFEKLAEARPSLVVGERALHGALSERLGRGGPEVLLVDSTSVAETFAGLLEVGRRVERQEAMQTEVAAAERALDGLRLESSVPTLILFGTPGSFMVMSSRTWLGDLAVRLGYTNVAAGLDGGEKHPGFVQLSDETIAGLRPELVLLVAHGDPDAIRAAFRGRVDPGGSWAALGTGARRGVHVLPADVFGSNPGLQMPEAARRLRDLAAPQVGHRP